jgi:BASS family bile acid:Na+ symporter
MPAVSFLFNRTTAILFAFTAGALLPQAHVAAGAVRYLIMTMLFIVFLQTRFSRESLRLSHAVLFAANIGMGFLGLAAGWLLGGRNIALALFFAGITPTATAAAVIVSFLRGRVDYVVAAFLLTNLGIAALMPLLLPFVLGEATPDVFGRVFTSVLLVVFLPMAVALLLRWVHPACTGWPAKLRNFSFGLWLSAMFLIMANASHFLRSQEGLPSSTLWEIGLGSILICALNFALGRWIGGREFGREASQALGQKNTAFTIYLAMTYASPLIALGPTFYVIWHNLWNSLQLHRARKGDTG